MSGHAGTIRRYITESGYRLPGYHAALESLDAFEAELVTQADRIAWLEGEVAGLRIGLTDAKSGLRIIADNSTDNGSRQLAEAILAAIAPLALTALPA